MTNECQDLKTRSIAAARARRAKSDHDYIAALERHYAEAYGQLVKVFPLLKRQGDLFELCDIVFKSKILTCDARGCCTYCLRPPDYDYPLIYDEASLGSYLLSLESRPTGSHRGRGFWESIFG